ncbi:hypothetical protein ACEWY4_019281 [Coilia grayii]|uniref:Gypsy retrotransposon integrase-like protein 1 n=1 Tax=Coilia grayii TaxID=363190 RepID=A0ABD1JFM9_9TELE
MTDFKVDDFLVQDVTRARLVRLTKPHLFELVAFCEADVAADARKGDIINVLLVCFGVADVEAVAANEESRKDRDLARKEREIAIVRRDRDEAKELAELELEQVRVRQQDNHRQRCHEARFDLGKCFTLMPRFCTDQVDVFFDTFERIARERQWPREEWVTLVRRELTGKAQEAYAALSPEFDTDYEAVKKAVLRAFELVPEAYRQQFRSETLKAGQTYGDFVRQQELLFDKWLRSSEVYTFQDLRQLMLLEQFKTSVPRQLQVHLNEQMVQSASQAAEVADNYVLIHKGSWQEKAGSGPSRYLYEDRRGEGKSRGGFHAPGRNIPSVGFGRNYVEDIKCHYCKQPGHIKSWCPVLQKRGRLEQVNGPRPVSLVVSERMQGLPASSAMPVTSVSLDPLFKGFVSEGSVAVAEGDAGVTVAVLRDTGATQSLLLAGVLDLPESTSLKTSVLVEGVGGVYQSVPLHQVFLRSNIINGLVTVGVVPLLPVKGISLLLGNDLAGSQVCVSPIVSVSPCESLETEVLEAQFPSVFPACVVTRSMARAVSGGATPSGHLVLSTDAHGEQLSSVPPSDRFSTALLIEEQKKDRELAQLREAAASFAESREIAEGFYLHQDVLMRKWRPPDRPASEDWAVVEQVVLPVCFRKDVLRLAHETAMAGHVGVRKTQGRITRHFYWPRLHKDVVAFVQSCHVCQVSGKPNQKVPVAPLCPPPIVIEPFSRVLIDCVGPLPRTKKGNEFLFTIMDVTTRFPEAIPLRNIKTRTVVDSLLLFFSRFGLPKEVQSDRGTNFTSGVFQQAMDELGITQVVSSAYHSQSQGAIERYHQTLKTMIRAYCVQFPGDWDCAIPFLLFAIRDSVNDSTGFSPFELVYGHEVRGPLKMMKDQLLEVRSEGSLLQYVSCFKERLVAACEVARSNMGVARERMKLQHDKKAVDRTFAIGDKVLVLKPMRGSCLGSAFSGPYMVRKKVGDRNYVIDTPDCRRKTRMCHVNLLKQYHGRSAQVLVSCVSPVCGENEGDDLVGGEPVSAHLSNAAALDSLEENLSHLSPEQRVDICRLVREFASVFQDRPGLTTLAEHDVEVGQTAPIKQHPYRLPPFKLSRVREEVAYMEEIGAVEPGQSDWSSPVVLVPKPDESWRLCIDYRKVNLVTRTDAFPIPRLEDCIDQIGRAQYVSKIDLLKGYWQVPLSARAREISAFATSEGLYVCNVLPFGMKNAPATFQRLMGVVTAGLHNVVTYIDDVVAHSATWREHVEHLRQLLQRLQQAGLVVNLKKCEIGKGQVTYLGHLVGRGVVMPRQAKVQAILSLPAPKSRREVMQVLGMCGFYRRFVPNFAAVAEPLTSLLRKGVKFVWSSGCERAFNQIKAILSCEPVLAAPDFSAPFKLAVDACDVGVGAVLLQADSAGLDKPVAYFSRKLNRHQKAYSTIEKEALGLVLAVQHFEIYLSGSHGDVVVYTDHNPLTFLARFRTANQRVFRWGLVLQPYSLVVKHVAGRNNVIADTLSRLHPDDEG